MKKIDKNITKKVLIFFLIILFFIIGILLINFSKNNYVLNSVLFQEDNKVNYKVYLKDNNFFESKYLDMNQTYIASLIDYIDIDFNYNISFSDIISDSYYYRIDGIISADKSNGSDGSYWSKTYNLFTSNLVKNDSISNINISDNIIIDYQKYNDLLNSFKSQFGLSIDGKLKVLLTVYHNTVALNEEVNRESVISLEIPLTSLTIEVPIKTDELNSNGELISIKEYSDKSLYKILNICGYLSLLISLIMFIIVDYYIICASLKVSKYSKTLKKILRVYDSIIVTIKEIPDTSDLEVIEVDSFDELLDAHSEVRKPINLKVSKNYSTFILINEGLAWKYVLSKNDIERN